MIHDYILASRILRWLLDFWKILGPLCMIYLRAKFHLPASSGTSLLVKSEFSHRCHVTIIYSPKYYIKKGLHLPTIVISAPQRKWSQCSFRRYQVSRKSVKCSKLKWTHKCMYNNNNNIIIIIIWMSSLKLPGETRLTALMGSFLSTIFCV